MPYSALIIRMVLGDLRDKIF